MLRLEDKCERAFQLLQDRLDKISERKLLLLAGIKDVFGKNGGSFRISFSFKFIPALLKN